MTGRAFILLCVLGAGSFAKEHPDFSVLRDSLLTVPPKIQTRWLKERGYRLPGLTEYLKPESTGLRLVGKWGRGRAWEVTGQDSLVFMSLGSEVAILNFADPEQPELLTELQLDYLALQARVRDSLLVTGRNGIDLWSISDPRQPTHLSHIPCFVSDFDVVDTFLYFVSTDTFNIYNIARPASPARIGFCQDSGEVVTATRNTSVLLLRDFLAFIDVSDPTAPHQVGTYGGWPLAAAARGNLCCATFENPSQPEESWFDAIDISNPAAPVRLARLDDVSGIDVALEGSYAFVPMQIVSIADSTHPYLVGEQGLGGMKWGIWASLTLSRCLVASDCVGLQSVDISDLGNPQLDTFLLRADMAVDAWVDGDRAYVANYRDGLKVLDVTVPASPVELGGRMEDGSWCETVVARDSFAFVGWWPRPTFRTVLVSDPTNPQEVAGFSVPSKPEDMVLRDTLVFGAGRLRFYAVNVAQPRESVLVGSCVTGDATSAGLSLRDTLAFVGNFVSQVVSIADPASPAVVGTFGRGAWNVAPRDTFAFVSSGGVIVYSIADPSQPHAIDSLSLGPSTYWVEPVGGLLYTGNRDGVHVVDATDVHNMREVGFCATPYSVKRLHYSTPYVYASCWDAGVCIFESTQVAVGEVTPALRKRAIGLKVLPNPAADRARLKWAEPPGWAASFTVRDVLGKEVMRLDRAAVVGRTVSLDVTTLASGVYYVEAAGQGRRESVKFVKR
ncbi:MAG: T9SS type A sorting domain-containing protein [candidate division WOR-3 bacterium]|nr:MAG: T9SS type A sorting domain-containing protein [candidate division WOR-3 bacterium]